MLLQKNLVNLKKYPIDSLDTDDFDKIQDVNLKNIVAKLRDQYRKIGILDT